MRGRMSFTQLDLSGYRAKHFLWRVEEGVGYVTLNIPERKNPLTFDSYAELRDLFRNLVYDRTVRKRGSRMAASPISTVWSPGPRRDRSEAMAQWVRKASRHFSSSRMIRVLASSSASM